MENCMLNGLVLHLEQGSITESSASQQYADQLYWENLRRWVKRTGISFQQHKLQVQTSLEAASSPASK